LITGAVVSRTMNDAVEVLVLLLESKTLIVIVFVPRPTVEPMAGDCVTVGVPQLSVATTALVKFGTLAWQLPLAEPVMFVALLLTCGV